VDVKKKNNPNDKTLFSFPFFICFGKGKKGKREKTDQTVSTTKQNNT